MAHMRPRVEAAVRSRTGAWLPVLTSDVHSVLEALDGRGHHARPLSGEVQITVNNGEPVDRAGFFDWYENVYQSPTTDPTNNKESNMNISNVTCADPGCEGYSDGGQFDPVSFADDQLCVCRDCGSLAGLPYLVTAGREQAQAPTPWVSQVSLPPAPAALQQPATPPTKRRSPPALVRTAPVTAVPAVPAVPAATPLEGTWTKLRSDNWGARIPVQEDFPVAAGARVKLLRKSGRETLVSVTTVVARFKDRDHPGWFVVLAEVSRV